MTTSGTVSTTVFQTRKLIEHAYRRVGVIPEQLTPDRVQTALDLLYLRLSAIANEGYPLWAIQKEILPLYYGTQTVLTPVGTVNLQNCNLRTLQRLTGTPSASEGEAQDAFDGDLETECTQVSDGGWIQIEAQTPSRVTTLGILPNVSDTWDISLQGSEDGISFTTLRTFSGFEASMGEWFWVDLEGIRPWKVYRLQAEAGTVLDVVEFYLGNQPREIPLAPINRDDYYNLPDKVFLGRPTQYWYDRQRVQPVINLWPAPAEEFTFAQLVLSVHRQIEDVGTMIQEVEVPQRWKLAIMSKLAADVGLADPEADPGKVAIASAEAETEWSKAWAGESDSSPVYLRPNISPYTR